MRAWLTPGSIPEGYECRAFLMPITAPEDKAEYEAIIRGAFLPLIDPANFEQEGITPDEAATVFAIVLDSLLEGIMCTPTGLMAPFPGSVAPVGWLMCDGSQQLQSSYPFLYAVIGDDFGSADSGYFRLPDMRDRSAIGAGLNYSLAESGGEREHTLTYEEMPEHQHGINNTSLGAGGGTGAQYYRFHVTNNSITAAAGDGLPHNNMPPHLALNWIIFAGL